MKKLSGSSQGSVLRVIDANINRTKEGLRVCEEIARFILESRNLTAQLKKIRHGIDDIAKRLPDSLNLISERDALGDVGRKLNLKELSRRDCRQIFTANIQRVKESIRVLEEFSKLLSASAALGFKEARYTVYEIEKRAAGKIASLCHHR